MSGEGEAAADLATGALVADAVEGDRGGHARHETFACPNCQAMVSGAYCSNCGQAAHIHRSLASIGHDILHGVFHFDGKFWRTLPELFFRPGDLTRRYINGERAKFISPMALFLFAVFTMFAVFSFTGGPFPPTDVETIQEARVRWQEAPIEATQQKIAALRTELAGNPAPQRRAQIDQELIELRSSLRVTEALQHGDVGQIAELQREIAEITGQQTPPEEMSPMERRITGALRKLGENPDLLFYKLKANGYKFSWELIPLSVPFMWLLFFWRRDIYVYDHAVFTTYSISFMMLLAVVLSLIGMMGVQLDWIEFAFVVIAPWHLYRQLRGAYNLSRAGALIRLFFLLIASCIVAALFTALLFAIGVLD